MPEVKINNLIKLYIITLLHQGPKHGYELIKELEAKLEKNISPSQMYPFLKTLQKNRLIKVEERGEREKKTYHLTKQGEAFVLRMFNRFGGLIDIAVEPKLTVCAHCGCKIFEGGYKEKIKGKNIMFCCSHCAASFKHCHR